ncbi:MAG: ADP-ribosylglycohydrolase family protein [Firmicutes bacterium]|nr:ADP-ribosylglycohydrolase family protein [Bacillota bacterium]
MSVSLRDKFIGCIAGCHIGSAMGAVTESMDWQFIEEAYGFIEKPLPYERPPLGMKKRAALLRPNRPVWKCEAGMTEDGVERQRLMILAIRDKGGRVTADDVKKSWAKYMNPASFGTLSMEFERVLWELAKADIPGADIGKYCDYAGLNSFARACHAIALINAGNIETVKDDIFEVGQLYQTAKSRGLKWACVTGVAIAAATLPDATVESVLQAIYDNCDPMVVDKIRKHVEGSAYCKDIRELREYFDGVFSIKGIDFSMAYASEVVTKGVCIFAMVKGNTKEAMIAGTNMGRDTDCVTAVAAGISGALTGYQSIPQEWFDMTDYATRCNPYTCSYHTVVEFADMIYNAYQKRLADEKAYVSTMQALL